MGLLRKRLKHKSLILIDKALQNTQRNLDKLKAEHDVAYYRKLKGVRDVYGTNFDEAKFREEWFRGTAINFDERRSKILKGLKVEIQRILF